MRKRKRQAKLKLESELAMLEWRIKAAREFLKDADDKLEKMGYSIATLRGKKWVALLFLLAFVQVQAATTSTTGTSADFASKVSAASTGDTILFPSGSSITWSSATLSIPSTKGITVDLNGCTITFNSSTLTVNSPSSGSTINRVTNGSIVRGSGGDAAQGVLDIADTRTGVGVRVDNITFTGGTTIVNINGQGKGVMDNCDFPDLDWTQEFIHIWGWNAGVGTGWTTDTGATLAGSEHIFYIEDCSFVQPNSNSGVAWIQGYYGCRIGIRSNYFDFVSVDMHGTADQIGARWWEGYLNVFHNDTSSGQPDYAFSMRAGSGVLFSNKMSLTAGQNVNIGLCEESSGHPADYQIGRGLNQTSDPAYVWNNTSISLLVDECDATEVNGMVEVDRDVFASARPDYTAYTYPHPLRGEEGGGETGGGGGAAAGTFTGEFSVSGGGIFTTQ